jgi:hypothetical protein
VKKLKLGVGKVSLRRIGIRALRYPAKVNGWRAYRVDTHVIAEDLMSEKLEDYRKRLDVKGHVSRGLWFTGSHWKPGDDSRHDTLVSLEYACEIQRAFYGSENLEDCEKLGHGRHVSRAVWLTSESLDDSMSWR